MDHLECAWVYIDDLLALTNGSFEEYASKLDKVLHLLQKSGLKCNSEKGKFFAEEIEYTGYLIVRDGIQPLPEKVKAILVINSLGERILCTMVTTYDSVLP